VPVVRASFIAQRRPPHDPCDGCAGWLSHTRPDLLARTCGCLCHCADPLQLEIDRTALALRSTRQQERDLRRHRRHFEQRLAQLRQLQRRDGT
jgi:hypothetical protein